MTAATAPRPIADSLAMTGRSMRHTVRNLDALLVGVLLPALILVLFTTVFGGALDSGSFAYIDYVVPGIILLCGGYGASLTATSVAADLTEGILDRFRTMAVFGPAVLVGHVAASVLRNAFAMVLTFGVALALGFRPTADAGGWAAAVGVLLLFVLAMSWLSAFVGLLLRSVEAASAFGFALLFMPYVSSAFVPIATLPEWLQSFAEGQPITPINEAVRGLFFSTGTGQLWPALAWCVGILLASIVGCVILWRRSIR